MPISKTTKFGIKHILLPLLFTTIAFILSPFPLTFGEFTLAYWSLIIAALLLNRQAWKWTRYITDHYGIEKEKNPTVREILATKNYGNIQTNLLKLCVFLFVVYVFGIFIQFLLIIPSWILGVLLLDFLNDFYWFRKLTNSETN